MATNEQPQRALVEQQEADKPQEALPTPAGPSAEAALDTRPSSEDTGSDKQNEKLQNGSSNEETPIERSRVKILIIMLALGMAVFLAAIDITIITTALPTISEYFHSSAGYTWIGSAYLLANAASTPIWGKVSDIFGRKPMLLLANFIFFVGSLVAALSINIGMLITGRAIQGLGGGGLVVLVNITVGDLFSPRRRGAYYGIIGGVWALASALGPIIGGAFTQKVSWRWCFYINLPLDGLAFIIILIYLDVKTPRTPILAGLKAIDWIGGLLVVGGTLMFLFGISYGGETFPWDSAAVICLLVFGVLCWVLFFVWEVYGAEYPIMPVRIFKKRSNLASLGVCFSQSFVFISGSYYLPLYFQAVLGATPILSGVYTLATALSLSVASIATGIFIRKTGQYLPPIYVGLLLMTLGYGLLIDLDANSSWAKIILYQIVGGLGVGPNFQAPLIALQSLISPRDIAAATAAFGFTRNLATSISVVIGQVVFQNEMRKRSGMLSQALGPQEAAALGGGNAGANVQLVDMLPPAQKTVAREAFADSLSPMWIMYTCFAAAGVVVAVFISKNTLSQQHTETKTGLEAQKEGKQEILREEEEKKARKHAGRIDRV